MATHQTTKYAEMTEEQKKKAVEKAQRYYWKNKDICLERRKKWYDSTIEKRREVQRNANIKRKLLAVEYMGGVCSHCKGVFEYPVYEFHHIDPSLKEKDLTKFKQLKWERMRAELDKCIMLCANCHRLLHHKEKYEYI